MLVLVTALLVLVGLVLLVVGFAHNSLDLIYASIGCTAGAGLVLIYLGRVSRREAVRLAHDEAALESRAGSPPAPDEAALESRAGSPPAPDEAALESRAGSAPAPDEAALESRAGSAPAPDEAALESRAGSAPAPDGLVEDASPARVGTEAAGLDERSDPAHAQSDATPSAAPAPAAVSPEVSASAAANPDAPIGVAGDGAAVPAGEAAFPIEAYDDLRAGEILPLLRGLEPDELEEVRDRESAGKSRSVILRRVEELLASGAPDERATRETPPGL